MKQIPAGMTARKATATARGAIRLAARAEARVADNAGILFPPTRLGSG